MSNPYATPESDLTATAGNGAVPAYSGFWRRAAAALIDALCLLPLIGLDYLLTLHSRMGMAYVVAPAVLVPLWYHAYFVMRNGATPGKRIMKMRVTMADGTPVTLLAAILRYLPWSVITLVQGVGTALAALSMTDDTYASYGLFDRHAQLELLQPLWATYAGHAFTAWTIAMIVSLLATSKRRTLHDFLAGTVVLRTGA